jgi:hypothetical protein
VQTFHCAYNARTSVSLNFTFGVARSNKLPRFPRRFADPVNVLERESGPNHPHIERLRLDILSNLICHYRKWESIDKREQENTVAKGTLTFAAPICAPIGSPSSSGCGVLHVPSPAQRASCVSGS